MAIRALVGCYAAGGDVHALVPLLATWMGHCDSSATYWYLFGSPELFSLAGQRLEAAFETATGEAQ